ncbi:uncharacterized protein TIGR03905 [Lachnospiraceae bacterium]|nr:uncharacterized protein TIGR03905 [Lachnospiraceae bacterium]
MQYDYKTKGVCAMNISFELDDDMCVHNVKFQGGCNGNLKAIGLLVEGMKADEVEKKLAGNTCGFKNTSCADQFAKALSEAVAARA